MDNTNRLEDTQTSWKMALTCSTYKIDVKKISEKSGNFESDEMRFQSSLKKYLTSPEY